MKIKHIEIYPIQIPFSFSIDHHLKNRARSSSIVIAVHGSDGNTGFGEGAPREYVTGESLTEVVDALQEVVPYCIHQSIESVRDIDDLCQAIYARYPLPAMVGALEIAFLDLLGQEKNCSVSDFFDTAETFPLVYSGVLPHLPTARLKHWMGVLQKLELTHIKMKVGYDDDFASLTLARQMLGEKVDIRVDANRAWTFDEAIGNIQKLEQLNISCVEEPLIAEDIDKLPLLSRKIATPIMLDESLCNLEEAAFYIAHIEAAKLLFNIKISKSGGLRAASKIHNLAQSHQIGCQLGCNVGETAILSAAGRIFAQTHSVKYLEGSFAPFFMEDDIGFQPICFAKKGLGIPLTDKGLGIKIDMDKLQKYSTHFSIA